MVLQSYDYCVKRATIMALEGNGYDAHLTLDQETLHEGQCAHRCWSSVIDVSGVNNVNNVRGVSGVIGVNCYGDCVLTMLVMTTAAMVAVSSRRQLGWWRK
jgi:hypothetical protein